MRGPATMLAAVWVALLAAGIGLGLIVEGNGFDGSAVRSVAGERTAALTAAARPVTDLGGLGLDFIFAAAAAGLLLAGRRRDAVLVVVGAGGAMLLTNAIKVILERPRPGGGGLVTVASASWPSGHAASSIALYGALAAVAGRSAKPWVRAAAWAAVVILLAAIGASRVYLGVHYPSDVAAGWLVGGLWLLAVWRGVGAWAAGAAGGPAARAAKGRADP